MSITIEGSLRIKRINGANGPFCVGDLNSEIGEFRVKDSVSTSSRRGTRGASRCRGFSLVVQRQWPHGPGGARQAG